MLGRHHISISVGTVVPFIVPLIFVGYQDAILYSAVFIFCVLIGSLTPDADCGGNATLHYRFKYVDLLMKKAIIPLTLFLFKQEKFREKIKVSREVDGEHRGIMHSPTGILISSLFIILILTILLILFGQFNILLVLIGFFGLLIGQALHLLEDSCTVSGIDWAFPYGEKVIKGGIYTFEKMEGKKDIRPIMYQYSLALLSIVLFLGFMFNMIKISLWFVYPIILTIIIAFWFLIIYFSRLESNFWYRDADKVNRFVKFVRSLYKKRRSRIEYLENSKRR
jgi:hypothetical protein